MKCCESPTTSIAVRTPDDRRAATAAMQAIVFSEVLKPLAAALGPAGDEAVGAIAQSLFVRAVR